MSYDSPIPLTPDFFAQATLVVAKALLGHYLIYQHPEKGRLPFKIVETEAYTEDDPACHAYGKRAGRAATLYEKPGLAYVYMIYGMYYCLNVVTELEGQAGAVLFRALEPPTNMLALFKTHGPGRLCKALDIDNRFNRIDLTSAASPFFLATGQAHQDTIIQTTRIGIQKAKDNPWRFYLLESQHISTRDKQAGEFQVNRGKNLSCRSVSPPST